MTYFFVLLISYLSGMSLHAFHVSVSQMEFDENKQQLEITHRIFLDDLEITLQKWSGEKIDVMNPEDPHLLTKMIGEYLNQKMAVSVNGKASELSYLGAEMEDDVMYCYLMVSNLKKFKSIKVKNTALMEVFDDQVNLTHIEINGETRSLKLTKKNIEESMSFVE